MPAVPDESTDADSVNERPNGSAEVPAVRVPVVLSVLFTVCAPVNVCAPSPATVSERSGNDQRRAAVRLAGESDSRKSPVAALPSNWIPASPFGFELIVDDKRSCDCQPPCLLYTSDAADE